MIITTLKKHLQRDHISLLKLFLKNSEVIGHASQENVKHLLFQLTSGQIRKRQPIEF